jgi:hypothetical protein
VGIFKTPRIKGKRMKVTVKYSTEFGSSESIMNVEKLAKFSKKFDIMSVIPYEEPIKETLEETFNRISNSIDYSEFDFASFKIGVEYITNKK